MSAAAGWQGELFAVSRETVHAADVLPAARARRRELLDQDDDGPGPLTWVRCPHHQTLHWRGIRCPACTFRAAGPPPEILAYGSRARRAARVQALVSRGTEGAGH